jgi:hypothetical protein
MANTSLATLESALRARKLDRTLTTALPSLERTDASALAPTAVAALDACLRGGLPRGHLSEIAGPHSSGRMSLLFSLLMAATRRSEIVALIDTFDRLDVASVSAAGIELDRLLWVRGQAISKTETGIDSRWHASSGLLERTIDRALKAFNLVLQAGGFGVVALDLADVPLITLKRVPFTTWLRIQRVVEGSDTASVIVVPQPLARSAGGVTLGLGSPAARWAGESDRSRRLDGLDVTVRIVSPRRRVEGEAEIRANACY